MVFYGKYPKLSSFSNEDNSIALIISQSEIGLGISKHMGANPSPRKEKIEKALEDEQD